MAAGVALAIPAALLAGCGDDDDAAAPDPATASGGLADCAEQPTTCNEGERADGGEIVWLIEEGWASQWNAYRPEGGSFHLGQVLAGITPRIGWFDPEGAWTWNLDLLEAPPELVDDAPQTMVYRLRDEATWSDGEPIDVDDFRYLWFHQSGRADHCQGCDPADTTGFADVESIEADSTGKTITITYAEGVTDPEWFARFEPSWYPAHVAEEAGFDWRTPTGMGASSEYFRDTVPTWSGGAYLIESAIADERVVMVPNPGWYGSTQPTLDALVKEVVANQADWPVALANEEIHGGAPLSFNPDVVDRMRGMPDASVSVGSGGATWEHVDVNLANRWLADPALRKAIFTAIDTRDARSRIFGDHEPPLRTNHIFSETSPHHQDLLAGTGYGTGDVEAVRDILAEAGYDGYDPGGTLSRNGEDVPPLRFTYISGHPTRTTFVELATTYLAEIGMRIAPTPVPGAQFGETLTTGDFDLIVYSFDGGPLFTHTPSQFFHSESGINFSGLDSAEVDRLAEEVLGQVDVDASAARANDVVGLVMDEASMLPLWDRLSFVFVAEDYVNVRDNLNSPIRALYNARAWGVAAR